MDLLGKTERLLITLGLASIVCTGLFLAQVIGAGTARYWFMLWNLWLAWLPVVFAWGLHLWLKRRPWLSWQALVLTVLWLAWLPNSFYIISDLIHLYTGDPEHLLYDAAMLTLFGWVGAALGFTSLYFVHRKLLRRLKRGSAHMLVGLVLLLSSFAIYLGRDLRWNTWDILVNPAGLLYDISDTFINPSGHPQAFSITMTFLVILGTLYFMLWQFIKILREEPRP